MPPLLIRTLYLIKLRYTGIELVVSSLLCKQIVVVAALDDLTVLQHHDGVGVADGGEAVGYHEGGAALHERIHSLLDEFLGAGVY